MARKYSNTGKNLWKSAPLTNALNVRKRCKGCSFVGTAFGNFETREISTKNPRSEYCHRCIGKVSANA